MAKPKIIDARYRVVSAPREPWFGSWRGLFWFLLLFGGTFVAAVMHRT